MLKHAVFGVSFFLNKPDFTVKNQCRGRRPAEKSNG